MPKLPEQRRVDLVRIKELNRFFSVLADDAAANDLLVGMFARSHLTQAELARRARLSEATVHSAVHCKRPATLATYVRMMAVLTAEVAFRIECGAESL